MEGQHETAESLVARAREGDEDAFAQLVAEHTPLVYRILASQVGASEAEDATQEVFLRVHRGLPRFRGDARLTTWIHRIATNVGLQRIRNRRRRPFFERLGVGTEPASPLPAPDAEIGAEERRDALRRALELLPEGQRAVVTLRMQGIPFEQIARTLGIRRPTAESRMARGKDRLRVLLADWVSGSDAQ